MPTNISHMVAAIDALARGDRPKMQSSHVRQIRQGVQEIEKRLNALEKAVAELKKPSPTKKARHPLLQAR
jgi:hypothetical protein